MLRSPPNLKLLFAHLSVNPICTLTLFLYSTIPQVSSSLGDPDVSVFSEGSFHYRYTFGLKLNLHRFTSTVPPSLLKRLVPFFWVLTVLHSFGTGTSLPPCKSYRPQVSSYLLGVLPSSRLLSLLSKNLRTGCVSSVWSFVSTPFFLPTTNKKGRVDKPVVF